MEKIELKSYKPVSGYHLEQLELDYFQHFILGKLFQQFNSVYFKGGTCLQKCYGIKRFSEDLDFNFIEININTIIKFIEKVFNTKIIDFYETRFGVSFSIRIKGILYNENPASMCKLSFDFRENDVFREPLKKIIRPVYKDLPRYFLIALNEEEILAEKIRAVLTRFKARDIYDLNELLLNNVKIDMGLVNMKLSSYNKVFSMSEFEIKLEQKRTIYDQELKRLTRIFDDFNTCKENIMQKLTV